ncbi:MAG TPA: class I SAM-dependent methyltransferase [Bryobacteraceae bacterium]|nr:class I SAM-dependent methyltransferase [Bryobacteraceae bacterium]
MSQNYLINEDIYEYIVASSVKEPEILRRLREETASHPRRSMQISRDQGHFFRFLVEMLGAKKALEIGVFTGYSALSVALALPEDGLLVACDVNEEYTAVARRYWREAGVEHKVDLRLAPALETLRRVLEEDGQAGTFDFAFIDADKTSYAEYFEYTLKLLRKGGVVAIDNVLQDGRVLDSGAQDANIVAIREFNRKLAGDPRVVITMLPIADGVTLALKR